MEIGLNLCVAIIKQNIKGNTEFAAILSDLGIEESQQTELCDTFQAQYVTRLD